jgi:raffinose/stachyose/melibiose transport system substrate-binding protein
MYVMGSWGIAQAYADDSLVKGKISAAKFPTMPDGIGNPDVWLGQPSVNIALSNTCKSPEGAIQFLKYWTSETPEKYLGEVCGQIPSIKVALDESKVYPLSIEVNNMIAQSQGMFIFYDVGLGAKIGDEFNNTVQSICAMKDVEEALRNLQTFTEENR